MVLLWGCRHALSCCSMVRMAIRQLRWPLVGEECGISCCICWPLSLPYINVHTAAAATFLFAEPAANAASTLPLMHHPTSFDLPLPGRNMVFLWSLLFFSHLDLATLASALPATWSTAITPCWDLAHSIDHSTHTYHSPPPPLPPKGLAVAKGARPPRRR
jgi:hypothetical protein